MFIAIFQALHNVVYGICADHLLGGYVVVAVALCLPALRRR